MTTVRKIVLDESATEEERVEFLHQTIVEMFIAPWRFVEAKQELNYREVPCEGHEDCGWVHREPDGPLRIVLTVYEEGAA